MKFRVDVDLGALHSTVTTRLWGPQVSIEHHGRTGAEKRVEGRKGGNSEESKEGNQFKFVKRKKQELEREENKVSSFPGEGHASTIGLSIRLSPESLKELKCKSWKLNRGHSVNRGGFCRIDKAVLFSC